MPEFLSRLLGSDAFMPHGHCYFWNSSLIRLHVISDSLITVAYYSIPLSLVYFLWRRRDVPYPWMLLMFVAFIFACGTTHLVEVLTVWKPAYWVSGVVKAVTAVLSVATALLLVKIIPEALKLKSPAELENANRKLQAVNRELETFSYSISHDLRAPVRAISGFTKILYQDHAAKLDPEASRLLKIIRDNTENMGQLIDGLLNFSRFSRQEMVRTTIDMGQLVASVWNQIRAATPATLVVKDMPPAQGDVTLVRQVLFNLLSNAVKYSSKRPDAAIEVGGSAEKGENIYYVKDNGAGFDMSYAHKLFGVFQRLHTREEFEGNGVGLAIVERIISRHGGRVWGESELGQGAVFRFTLPPAKK
jgi:light-regulated signal transduction histidine kinase (bacteriophytochrome)